MLPKDYYKKVEEVGFLKHILYSDTDSVFISVPTDISKLTLDQKWELAEKSADDINEIILKYLKEDLLPRCNINPEQNQTYFKTELVFDSAMFMDVKKQYAYKLLIEEGNVLEEPKIEYTGIQVVKSDAAKLTQNLLKKMIEDIALNSDIPKNEKIDHLSKVVTKFKQQFDDDIMKVQYQDIGLPGKWGGRVIFVNGMKLYNFIMNREIFSISSAGKLLYCKFHNPPALKGIDLKETKGICVPYAYDTNEVKMKMEQFGIQIDADVQWSKLFTTTCERVIGLIKQSCR